MESEKMSLKRTTKEGRGDTHLSINAQLKIQNIKIASLESRLTNANINLAEKAAIIEYVELCHEIEEQENFLKDIVILTDKEIKKLEPENQTSGSIRDTIIEIDKEQLDLILNKENNEVKE
jgi:hypothetical protein